MTAFGFSKLLGYDVGTAAGHLAGALSLSTVIGAAGEAIQRLAIPGAAKTGPVSNIPVAYAIGNILLTAWGPVLVSLMSIGKRGASVAAALAHEADLEVELAGPANRAVGRWQDPADRRGVGYSGLHAMIPNTGASSRERTGAGRRRLTATSPRKGKT